jgi:hypothetical protein
VVAQPDGLRFYVDESALGLGKALQAARRDTIYVGHQLIPECPLGVLDPQWIPAVAARELVAIGRDKHIRTRPAEQAQIRDAGLRVLRIGGKRDLPTWEWLVRLVKRWDDIETLLRDRPAGP